MKRTVLVSLLTVIGWLVPISIIAQEVGKEGDTPEPPRIESLTVDEMRGDWKAEKIGDKESPEDDIVIKFKDEKSQKLVVEGKYKDWEADGVVADGKITFTRKPKAAEMSDKAPQWARDKIAAEGKLNWKLELKAESRKGEWVLEGKWYPGQFKWKEAGDGKGAGQEASYLDEGKPVEVKFKREPAIIDVLVLNNQTGFANGNPLHRYPGLFRPPPNVQGYQKAPHTDVGSLPIFSREERTPHTTLAPPPDSDARTLFIYGPNLPKDFSKKIELQSGDKTLGYSVRAFATDHGLSPDNNRLFKVGWDEAVKGLDEDTKKSVKKCAALLVSVRFGRGVVPGLKNFVLNKMEASWRLRFGDDRAWIRFVRDVTANQTEVISSAYMPERIYIEIRTETPFPINDIPLRAALNDKPIKWNGADTIVASHVSDEPTGEAYEVFHEDRPHEFIWKMVRVYRTPAIDISGESSPSGGNGYQLPVKAGDVCYAKLDDPYLLTATPPHGRVAIWENPQRDESGNFVLTWESALETAATLDGYSIKSGGNVRGKTAAEISNIVFTDIALNSWGNPATWGTVSKRNFNEAISHWTSIYPPLFADRFFFGDRGITENVRVTVGDHAALLLFKDTFGRKMKEELDTLEKITKAKSNPDAQKAMLRGWRDAIKPYAWDESSPWRSITVSGPNGDAQLSLALDDSYLASAFNGNRKAADDWSLKAVSEGLEKYKESIRFALQKAKDCPDNDVKKLIELIGYGYENLLPDLLPKMMRLAPAASGTGQVWQPDLNARWTLWNLHTAADAVRAQEDLSKMDTQMAFVASSALTIPFMFGEGVICAVALWAFDGATLGIQLVSETIPELWEEYNREEIKFALGASIVLGTDRLNEAELKKSQWYATVLSVLPSAMGFSMSSVQAIPRMQRAVAEAKTATLISQVEKHGTEAFKRFTDVERTAFLTSVSEAETLKEMGATHLMKKSHERAAAAGEKLAAEAGVKTATLKNRTATVEAIGNPAKSETAAVQERNYISLEEKSSKPATVKEGGEELTAKVDEKSTTLKAPDARAPTKPMSRAARDLDELEGLTALRGDKDPELNPLNVETTMPDGTKQSFILGKHRGKGAFATVYDVIVGKFKGKVVKFIWARDIFRSEEEIAKDMITCGQRLRDAKIPHLKIREVPGCAGAKAPFVIQEKLPVGAKAFSEGTDRNVIKAFLSQNGCGKATVKLFWQLKEAGLVLEDARVVNLYWEEVNGEWICGILDVDRVIPFAERNTPLGKVIDWVEACVTGDTVKSLYAARRSSFANRTDSALAFINRTPKGRVGPYLPSSEVFMEKMFEHKGWIDCEFLDAAGNVAVPPAEIKSVRYKDGLLTLDEIRELFPNFDDPARTKELDLTRPYHSSLLRIRAFILRTAAVSTISIDDIGQSQSQFPIALEFFTEDLLLAAA